MKPSRPTPYAREVARAKADAAVLAEVRAASDERQLKSRALREERLAHEQEQEEAEAAK